MKKVGLLHAELSRVIASLGHEDYLVIGDAGLPVPPGVPCIDLALVKNLPRFLDTVRAVLSEVHAQELIIDTEMGQISPHMRKDFDALIDGKVPVRTVPHSELQTLARKARAVVRTGEFTPYSNVIVVAGVLF